MKRILCLVLALLCLPLSVQADPLSQKQVVQSKDEPKLLHKLFEAKGGKKTHTAQGKLRERMLRQAGETLGFQQGFQWRYKLLADEAEKRSTLFDKLFRFEPLLLEGRVLPPVIRWAGPAITIENENSATRVEASYRIVAPAKLVSVVPTWRDYLLVQFEAFSSDDALLPQQASERRIWKEAVRSGWDAGLIHAMDTFESNMARLVSDYRGILHFRMLVEKGMASLPVLATGKVGIRVGERSLDLDETIFRITVPASFLQADRWKP